jgi:hypothetical protein
LFRRAYLLDDAPMTLIKQQTVPTSPDNRELVATLRKAEGVTVTIEGADNGPTDAFVDALKKAFGVDFSFIDYHEHAVGRGANATAASYVEIQDDEGRALHGCGDGPQYRDGLAQGHARRRFEADAAGGQGVRRAGSGGGARSRAIALFSAENRLDVAALRGSCIGYLLLGRRRKQ